jgi:hypothetical protein
LTKSTGPLSPKYTVEEWKQFYALMKKHFSIDEIDDIAFSLGISSYEIGGDTIGARARELIMYCQRVELTADLIQQVKELRPGVEWP